MLKQITLNGKKVTYELQRKKVKNVNLRIKADGTVTVSANTRVSEKIIEDFMRMKADFILNALARCEELRKNAPKPKEYADGEVFKVLGADMPLRIFEGNKNTAECNGTCIKLTVKDMGDTELKKKTLDKWFEAVCRETVKLLCDKVYPAFEKYGVEYPMVKYRHMKSRWGSCQPKGGVLTFNYALVHTPIQYIEYVVYHEFTHFLEPNHSKAFYDRLVSFLPDWQERKKLLEKMI